ncbi:MAG: hypothetical protein NTW01_18940 [Gammaproteobacteria bacterium]|uniref:hypothetical protein n=1 Tax=Nevskia sp. TaxID=1929292 RepID=UPI004035F08C|nr:hypothetical protein [Gammaproteobacteria bacterium]
MTHHSIRTALAFTAAVALLPVISQAAPACPKGMSVASDGKGCSADQVAASSGAGSFDVLGNIMDTTKKEINAKQAVETSKQEFLSGDARKKYEDGYWQHFQAFSGAKPGEYCAAMFARQGMSVTVLGPGGDYRGALMIFSALDDSAFPKSAQPTIIPVSLKQGSDPAATVRVFNFNIGQWQTPILAFAVPTIDAALQGMDDKLDFHLEHEGKAIGSIEWHSGHAARDALKQCLDKR